MIDQLRRLPAVVALADRMWPRLTPEAVVHEALRAAGIEPSSGWSEHDLALLDEANTLIGPPVVKRRRRRPTAPGLDENLERTLSSLGQLPACPSCGSELSYSAGRWQCGQPMCQKTWRTAQVMSPEAFQQLREIAERVAGTHHETGPPKATVETFGHVIVDEAQDLTPMQWRMLARRCPTGSMTLVGDLGQAKQPLVGHRLVPVCALAAPQAPHRALELTVNYRTPEEVMRLAASVLAEVAPELRPPAAVRTLGQGPGCHLCVRPPVGGVGPGGGPTRGNGSGTGEGGHYLPARRSGRRRRRRPRPHRGRARCRAGQRPGVRQRGGRGTGSALRRGAVRGSDPHDRPPGPRPLATPTSLPAYLHLSPSPIEVIPPAWSPHGRGCRPG